MKQRIQKWLAIRSYAKNLGFKLRKRYGVSRYYTPGQVKATVREAGLNLNLVRYALCMYCDRSSFIQYHIDTGETYDYEAIQNELAAQFSRNRVSLIKLVLLQWSLTKQSVGLTAVAMAVVIAAMVEGMEEVVTVE